LICIDCDVRRETAPNNFRANEGGYSYIFKQPENGEDEALYLDVMESWPVEAIGDKS